MIKVSGYELNLHTIMNSGQCFRIFEIKEHDYDLLSGNYAVHVICGPSSNCYLCACFVLKTSNLTHRQSPSNE